MAEKKEDLPVVRPRQHETRAVNIRRYERVMGPLREAELWLDRARAVTIYLTNPVVFPNGPDGRAWGGEAWYVPEEWRLEGGVAVRSVTVTKNPSVTENSVTENPDDSVTENLKGVAKELMKGRGRPREEGSLSDAEKQKRYRDRLKAAREVLARAEGKKGSS